MSLYDFKDINEAKAVYNRTVENLTINGNDLSMSVPGFTVLYVKGRESIPIDIDELDDEVSNGRTFQRKRHRGRPILVGYQIDAKTPEEFRESFNVLNSWLNIDQARYVFADEPGYYFVGTVSDIETPEGGSNCVKGEFTIYCADPYKYSIAESTANFMGPGSQEIEYYGVAPTHPRIVTEFEDSCGYISFDINGSLVRLGDPKQAKITASKQTLLNNGKGTITPVNPFTSGMPRTDLAQGGAIVQANTRLVINSEEGQGNACKWTLPTGSNYIIDAYANFKNNAFLGVMIGGKFTGLWGDSIYIDGVLMHEGAVADYHNVRITAQEGHIWIERYSPAPNPKSSNMGFDIPIASPSTLICGAFTEGGLKSSDAGFKSIYYTSARAGSLVRNTFVDGDYLEIKDGHVYLNDIETYTIGDVLNDYEGQVLTNNGQTVTVSCSPWSTMGLTQIKWRQVMI